MGIGDEGPMGRLLVRGEYGHDIIDELKPNPGEPIIDKPGKGSMWDTTLHRTLLARGITHLLFAGVTTECCVNTTARECADRGFETCILADCTDGFDAGFYASTFDMLCSYDGLFGFVGSSLELLRYAAPQAQTPLTTPSGFTGDISVRGLRRQYATGQLRPTDVVKEISIRISNYQAKDPAVWVHFQYTRDAATIFKKIDVLLVPTTTCHPTVAELEADPLALNAKLGYFTHFANVLDLCGIAVPASVYQDDDGTTLPFGVTLLGASGRDGRVYDIAREFERTK